jgi:stress response protein SCP2
MHTIVAGLRWERSNRDNPARHADLDLCCALLGARRNVLEIVHPGRTRNDNASVVHTGDCTEPSGTWDHERVFVFLPMLPPAVSEVVFVAASATGELTSAVQNASCHVSDHVTDEEHLRVPLTQLSRRRAWCAAAIQRAPQGWQIVRGDRAGMNSRAAVEMLALTAYSKF